MHVEKICATTWFVYPRPDGPKIGTINYPGSGIQEDKSKKYQACREGKEIGHFSTLDEAARAIFKN